MGYLLGIGVVAGIATALGVILFKRRRTLREAERQSAIASFPAARGGLAEPFRAAAQATGKPRGLRWMACDLDDRVVYAADRKTRDLYAFNGVTIRFEAVEGGDMEEVEAVGNLRAATAVFVCRQGAWTTDGRVVFNLDPPAAVERFRETIERVDAQSSRQRDAAG